MSEIFDARLALEQAGGSEELARDLFAMLLDELTDHQQAIEMMFKRLSSENGTFEALWDPVHKLHGATAYLGVPALRQAVKAFEDQIKQHVREQLDEGFRQLDAEINRLQENGPDILARSW
ncbi:hypothetical protein MNBD_GAMMA24-2267 [hydrothermal vent metagenome]|uniref:HPt domain-containing protein n=1 Tax=hydrothermal vent metagenome TaxID=652676 RepID=A0A3B1BSG7_9ZZZZ